MGIIHSSWDKVRSAIIEQGFEKAICTDPTQSIAFESNKGE